MPVELSERDRAMLEGREGEATALAMRIVVEMAGVMAADRLIDVTRAHVDSCLYHGRAGLDFAERLASGGARVRVPTTLNVGAVDLLHPERSRANAREAEAGRRQMELYTSMGARATWTCAPYQLVDRPRFGEQIAWAESNAIVFANSVLGARTNRYGDFIDVCAAITGRVPFAGLHRDEERRATIVLRLREVRAPLLQSPLLFPLLGLVLGDVAGSSVAAIESLPERATEDDLKALGAAAASSGAVAMFHAVGITPEASTLEEATGGAGHLDAIAVRPADLRAALERVAPADEPLAAVSVGTPHASARELERLASLADGASLRVPVWVNTSRDILSDAEARGVATTLRSAGVEVVTDTCAYVAPMVREVAGVVMTDSAKAGWYGPSNTGVGWTLGTLEECVRSAIEGRVVRDPRVWADD